MLDTILKNIREREIQKQKNKYKAADITLEEERTQDIREEDKYKGVF